MVNFHDPEVIVKEGVALVKLWHVMSGLYLWEFCTTLDYEWSVIRGGRKYRWTIWIYSIARMACLMGVILIFVGNDTGKPINCELWITSLVSFFSLSAIAASFLVVLRIIAIWSRNRAVMVMAFGVWVINVAFLIQGAAAQRLRFVWQPSQHSGSCIPVESESSIFTICSMVASDIALVLIMLVGLLRLRRDGDSKFGLTHLLWKQGLFCLLIATAAEVPPLVFIILNLNDAMNIAFQVPALVTMAIVGTRMHRTLVDYASRYNEVIFDNFQQADRGCTDSA